MIDMFNKINKKKLSTNKNNGNDDLEAESTNSEMDIRKPDYLRHFPNIEQEQILKRYSCALISDFLRQGNLYVTENYLAFHSNIFGYVTKLLIPLGGIESITKEKTAKIIPNAIGITTPEGKYVFGSLISRDKTFQYITKVWRRAILEVNPNFVYYNSDSNVSTSDDEDDEEEELLEESVTKNEQKSLIKDIKKFKANRWMRSKFYRIIYYTAIILIFCLLISSGILLQRIFKLHYKYIGEDAVIGQTELRESMELINGFVDDKLTLVSTARTALENLYSLLEKNQDMDENAKYF